MRYAMTVVAMVAVGCADPEPVLPALCDEPSAEIMDGQAEACDHCGGDCIELCAFYCDTAGNILATMPIRDSNGMVLCPDGPENVFCGRWIESD